MTRLASMSRLLAGFASVCVMASCSESNPVQTAETAQPAEAIPDLGSDGLGWSTENGLDFTPVPGSASPIVTDPKYPYRVPEGGQRVYHIPDLNNPNVKQWALDIMRKDTDEVLAGKIAHTASTSCLPWGVPAILQSSGPYFFIQQSDRVTIIEDEDLQARRVYLNVPHSQNPKPSYYGESVGHYENGDTLVIDTIGFNTKTDVDFQRTPHTEQLHVVERWKVLPGGKEIELNIKVEDPGTYNAPWEHTRVLKHDERVLDEWICQGGNFVLFDYGTPTDETPDF